MKGGWEGISRDLREIIERVCSAKEIEVLKLKAAGAGRRRMALVLDISESAVRDRLSSAERKVRREVAALRGIG
jgi:DNA-binding CsgD family transcriptional regulator